MKKKKKTRIWSLSFSGFLKDSSPWLFSYLYQVWKTDKFCSHFEKVLGKYFSIYWLFQIEWLIENGFIARDSNDLNMFLYVTWMYAVSHRQAVYFIFEGLNVTIWYNAQRPLLSMLLWKKIITLFVELDRFRMFYDLMSESRSFPFTYSVL